MINNSSGLINDDPTCLNIFKILKDIIEIEIQI